MVRLTFAASGEEVAVLDSQRFERLIRREGGSIVDLKRYVSGRVGCSRFRQRILHGSDGELGDEEGIHAGQELQLVILDFLPPSRAADQSFINACL